MNQPGMNISHIRQTDMMVQTNEVHQQGVSVLAAQFADRFGMAQFGTIMGLLHDKGKEQEEWQRYCQQRRKNVIA